MLSIILAVAVVFLFLDRIFIVRNFKKHFRGIEKAFEIVGEDAVAIKNHINSVAETAIKTDEMLAKGTDELAKHLKVAIVPFVEPAVPEKVGFKIEKLKRK